LRPTSDAILPGKADQSPMLERLEQQLPLRWVELRELILEQ
jgi:hypothetical protein